MKRDCIYQVLTVLLTCLFVLGSTADIYASAVNGYEQDTEALYGVIDSGEEGYGITGDESVTDSLQEADESELELPDASLSSTEDLSNGNDSEPSEAQDTSASESDLSGDLSETGEPSLGASENVRLGLKIRIRLPGFRVLDDRK